MAIVNLLLWPGSAVGARDFIVSASDAGSQLVGTSISYLNETLDLLFFRSLFRSSEMDTRPETVADRNRLVSSIEVSPHKLVGYVGDNVTFVAMGLDIKGQPAHGAKFSWQSSDSSKLKIDEAGRARLVASGLVEVTARAGNGERTVPVMIRPTRRLMQTDTQWKSDQDSLDSHAMAETSFKDMLASVANRLAPTAYAQGNSAGDYGQAASVGAVGTPPFAALEGTRLGPVMPKTNFELPLPLVSLGGRGLGTNLMLYYNSNTWGGYVDNGVTKLVFDPIQSWPSPGFSLGFGRIVYYNGYTDGNQVAWHSFMLIDPNGTLHNLGVGTDYGNNTLQTTDGSHITYVGNAVDGGTLYNNDGTAVTIGKVNNRLLPSQITDTNGNFVQIAYKWETNFPGIALNYVVDTQGRVIQFNYDAYNSTNLTSITTPVGTVTFNYQTVTMNYDFPAAGAVENAPASFSAVSSVAIPARPTYSFSYSGFGMIYAVSAASQGGTASVSYNYPMGGESLYDFPTFTQRTETPSSSPTVYLYNQYAPEVTRPDGTKLSLTTSVQELKNSSNQTLSKTEYTFTTDPGGSTAVQSIVSTDDAGQQTKVDFDQDAYGNVTNRREYGFQSGGQWQVRRRTHTAYLTAQSYVDAYMRNLPNVVEVFDVQQSDSVPISKSNYSYDVYGAMGGMEGYGGAAAPPGHLSAFDTTKTTRGNVTGVTKYTDVALGQSTTLYDKIDIFGNTVKAQVSCCSEKTFYCDGHTYWTKPCTETSGNPSDKCLTTIRGYDFNTMAVSSVTDPNNQTTTFTNDSLGRPSAFSSFIGTNGSTVYNAWGEQTSSSITYSEGVTKTLTQTAIYDAWGQMSQSIDANGAQTNYTYDNMGRLLTRTNPFAQGGTPGPVTTYHYDSLERNDLVTLPDGYTVQTSYSGNNVVTVVDQVNRKINRETDGLGRLIKVTEQDVSTGLLTQETSYTYDAADRLIGVNQGGQTRAFKYDSEGRLLFERIPEMAWSINDGGASWSTKYTYTDWGAVLTKQDARGVITNYTYDTLHRLTQVSYNTSGATDVASTPTVTYAYDNGGTCDTGAHSLTGSTKGLLLSITVGSGYCESYGYTVGGGNGGGGGNRITLSSMTQTIDGRSYTTGYQYNNANQLTQMTYPAGRVLTIGHDSIGRVSSLSDQYRTYINNFTYNGPGQLTGFSLGNVASETYGYDANRMQMISQTATKTGGPANGLMNLHYSYQATAAGQMGSGSTAGNAGQLMAIDGATSTIGGVTESSAYTYDNLGRLVTSNQTSNGSSAQRRFVYDRWGNRTGMWDATSGGNQIQAITLQQSGGAPTNQIATVTAGSTVNYLYDAAGNVINDGVHIYAYDGANRLVSVDGGATASYAYDQRNRRYKKTVGSSVTHYVWQGSQVQSEYDGTTGAAIYNYVYSGSRLIARMGSGIINWYLRDRLSTRLVLDASGNVIGRQGHLPFGEDFGENGTQEKHHFASYERESESGVDYALNRWYASSVGRFVSADPYRASGYLEDPRSWNRYSYTRNVLTNRVDRSGLEDKGTQPTYEDYHGRRGDRLVLGITLIEPKTPTSASSGSTGGGGFDGFFFGLGGLFDGIGRAKGPPLVDGNGTGPAVESRQDTINAAMHLAADILGNDNNCSEFFGGPEAATEVLGHLDLQAGSMPDSQTSTSIEMSGRTQPFTTQYGVRYRVFARAVVNSRGPFFMTLNTANGHVGERLPNVGSYSAGSPGARLLSIFHELAHMIQGPDGQWLIPGDNQNPTQSTQNTATVEAACGAEINATLAH